MKYFFYSWKQKISVLILSSFPLERDTQKQRLY
jgi:hypothetical protein